MSWLFKTLSTNQPRKIISSVILRTYATKNELPAFETLAVSEPKKHVFHVELNRPKKSNAFSIEMWRELKECFEALNRHSQCRVVVLSGQGKHFTGGIELNSLVQMAAEADELEDVARKARYHYHAIKYAQAGISALEECMKPVLSVTHNACVGAGIDLITAADMRYCTEDAWFTVKEVQVGLAADVGTLQRFPKVVGNTSTARELCFTGRNFDAKEAKDIGLVSQVFPDKDTVIFKTLTTFWGIEVFMIMNNFYYGTNPEIAKIKSAVPYILSRAIKHVLELAENIAAKSPVAVQTTKMSLVYSQDRTTPDGLEHIRLLNMTMNQGEDLPKAAIAQATKSAPPEFDNL